MSPRKILLADADPGSRELLRLYLERLGCPTPVQAKDGEEALDKALAEKPDLIVMEVRLPKLDGFEIVARLRRTPSTRNAQILAATASALPEDRKRCLANGFNGYLAKPFTYQQFGELLRAMLASDID